MGPDCDTTLVETGQKSYFQVEWAEEGEYGVKKRMLELVHYIENCYYINLGTAIFYPFPFQWICFDKAKFWMLL